MTSAELHGQVNSRPDREELEGLLAAVAGKDREALARLYSRTRGAVYALALSYLKNPADAQDVTQDTYVRVWENAGQYQARGTPMGWLLTLTRNLALMNLRQGSRSGELSEEEWEAIPEEAPAVTQEDKFLLQTALGTLAEGERRIVLLHASSGLKHREIATLLGMPLATVLSKYNRALKKLRARMEGESVG